jgi:hypothetical protein
MLQPMPSPTPIDSKPADASSSKCSGPMVAELVLSAASPVLPFPSSYAEKAALVGPGIRKLSSPMCHRAEPCAPYGPSWSMWCCVEVLTCCLVVVVVVVLCCACSLC